MAPSGIQQSSDFRSHRVKHSSKQNAAHRNTRTPRAPHIRSQDNQLAKTIVKNRDRSPTGVIHQPLPPQSREEFTRHVLSAGILDLARELDVDTIDAHKLVIVEILHSMVTHKVPPAEAARKVTAIVHDLTADGGIHHGECCKLLGSTVSPEQHPKRANMQRRDWEDFLYALLLRIASKTSWERKTHVRLVSFLRHARTAIEETHEKGYWPLPTLQWELRDWDRCLIDYTRSWQYWTPKQLTAGCKAELIESYINMSAFAARLLSAGMADTMQHCPLFQPHGPLSKSPRDRSINVHEYAAFTRGAAQWILHASKPLYSFCMASDTEHPDCTPHAWQTIKANFADVDAMRDKFRHHPEARDAAASAHAAMVEQERVKVKTDYCRMYMKRPPEWREEGYRSGEEEVLDD